MIIAICDDDVQDRKKYYKKISVISKEMNLNIDIQSYSNGNQLLFELDEKENLPDILYLDILMPNIDGLRLAEQLRSIGFDGEIIFLTLSDQYWSNAFDIHAYHYLLKENCSDNKFKEVFQNAVQAVLEKNEDYLFLNSCGTSLAIKIKDIYYFEVIGRIVSVYYLNGKFEFYSALSKLEEQLISRNFVRIHKSYLVSKEYITKVYQDIVVLKNDIKLPIGRKYKNTVNENFNSKGAILQ